VQCLTRFSNLPHQDWSRLQVPICVCDMRVAEIGAQGNGMARHSIAVVRTLLQ